MRNIGKAGTRGQGAVDRGPKIGDREVQIFGCRSSVYRTQGVGVGQNREPGWRGRRKKIVQRFLNGTVSTVFRQMGKTIGRGCTFLLSDQCSVMQVLCGCGGEA